MSAQAVLCSLARDSKLPTSTARELLDYLRTHQALKDALGDAAPELVPCSKVHELWRALLLSSREREAVERAFPGLTQVPHSTRRSQAESSRARNCCSGRAIAMTAVHCLLGTEPQEELWQEEGHDIKMQSLCMFRNELWSGTAFRPAAELLHSLEGADVSVESAAVLYTFSRQPQAQLQQQVQPNNPSAATSTVALLAARHQEGFAAVNQRERTDAMMATLAAECKKHRRGAETATAGAWQQQQQLAVLEQEVEQGQQQGHQDQEHGAERFPSRQAIKLEPRPTFCLIVRDTQGNTVIFKVPRDSDNFCISRITTAMCDRFGYNSSRSRMMWGSRQLQPDDRLAALRLRHGDMLLLDVGPQPDWLPDFADACDTVFVKPLTGKIHIVHISPQDSVLS